MSHLNFLSAKRRSVRRYAEGTVEPEVLRDLLESALRAPTSHNNRGCYFVVVDNRDMLERLSGCREKVSAFVGRSAVSVVVCARHGKSTLPYVDCAIAASYLQLAVTDNELGSCWCQLQDRTASDDTDSEAYVRTLLGLPSQDHVLCIIAIGVPQDKDLEPRANEPEWERVYLQRYEERGEE